MNDAAEFLAGWIEDVEAARTAAKNVPGRVDLHAVRHARVGAAQVGEDSVGLAGESSVRLEIEGADMSALRVVDVENPLIGRERKPVGSQEVIHQERERSAVGRNAE